MTPVSSPLTSDISLQLAGSTPDETTRFVTSHVPSQDSSAVAADLHAKLDDGTLNPLHMAGIGSRTDHSA